MALSILTAGIVSAQSVNSIGSSVTGGLFRNELDAAFSIYEDLVGPKFSELGKNYLFTGLTNINQKKFNANDSSIFGGFYKAGEMPWTVVGVFNHTDVGATQTTETTTFTGTLNSTVVGTTTYRWNDQETTEKRTVLGFDTISDSLAFYTNLNKFGIDANTGINFAFAFDNTGYNPANNAETVVTDYYNAAAAGVAPDVKKAGSEKTTTTNLGGKSHDVSFSVPFYIETGDLAHSASFGLGFSGNDSSTSTKVSYSIADATQYDTINGGSYTNSDDENINKSSAVDLSAMYRISLPGFRGHADNRHFASLSMDFSFQGQEASADSSSQDYAYDGVSAFVKTGEVAASDKTSYNYDGATDSNIGLTGGTRLYFDLGDGAVFGVMPSLSMNYKSDKPVLLADSKRVVKTDNNSDGDYIDVGDSVVTTTRTYTNGSGGETITKDFILSASAPVALKVKPAGWLFGMYFASTPTLSMDVETTTTKSSINKVETVTESGNGTGVTTTDTTTEAAEENSTESKITKWDTSATHELGLFFDLGKNLKLEAVLNASNLFIFENLSIQATFALP
jgi:hypothetical protein